MLQEIKVDLASDPPLVQICRGHGLELAMFVFLVLSILYPKTH